MCDQEKECKKECKNCYYYLSDGYISKCDYKLPKLGWTNKYFDNRLFGDMADKCECYIYKCDVCRYLYDDEDVCEDCVNYNKFKAGCIECGMKKEDDHGICVHMLGLCNNFSFMGD